MSFFVLKILTFLYYANEESDDVIGSSTKIVTILIKNISASVRDLAFNVMFYELWKHLPIS